MTKTSKRVNRVEIRMYRMGTGDCFTVKFMKGSSVSYKMMIDCGCWTTPNPPRKSIEDHVKALMSDMKKKVDALIVTHEHKDHVYGFERCKNLFVNDFEAKQIWMAWTEDDRSAAVKKWKTDYGQKRKALALAADALGAVVNTPQFEDQLGADHQRDKLLTGRKNFARTLAGFADLHATGFGGAAGPSGATALGAAATYVDGLAGMAVVKNDIKPDTYSYFKPGDVIENEPGLEGVRIYVLGPPLDYDDVKKESGPKGEAYEHNDKMSDTDAFAMAIQADNDGDIRQAQPFDDFYQSTDARDRATYDKPGEEWRRIDYDWLLSAGSLALRMNARTNNLSLVLAIEFIDSGKILLFPGDAEFGSWKSWQSIDWSRKFPGLTTEKLLNRVVFYKVAHHLSHNGTARSIGLRQMTSPDLTAMATLDYSNISNGWKSTMPNAGILKDLLVQTMGRTLVLNTDHLIFSHRPKKMLKDAIDEHRVEMSTADLADFDANVEETDLYISYTLDV